MSQRFVVYDSEWSVKNEWALDDEIENLKTKETGPILVLADLGLWTGRSNGYREFPGNGTLDRVFGAFSGDFFELAVEGGELVGKDVHHDGTNFYRFYEIVDQSAADKIEILHVSKEDIPNELVKKGIRPLGRTVSEIYGWEDSDE